MPVPDGPPELGRAAAHHVPPRPQIVAAPDVWRTNRQGLAAASGRARTTKSDAVLGAARLCGLMPKRHTPTRAGAVVFTSSPPRGTGRTNRAPPGPVVGPHGRASRQAPWRRTVMPELAAGDGARPKLAEAGAVRTRMSPSATNWMSVMDRTPRGAPASWRTV